MDSGGRLKSAILNQTTHINFQHIGPIGFFYILAAMLGIFVPFIGNKVKYKTLLDTELGFVNQFVQFPKVAPQAKVRGNFDDDRNGQVFIVPELQVGTLEQSLIRLDIMPCREGSGLADFLGRFGLVGTLSQDVVEQTIPRPVDDAAQEATYSGKKSQFLQKQGRLQR